MSDSNSPPSPESSSKNSPPSEESNTSPPSEGSSTSPPSEGSSSSPPSESSSSSPPSEASSSSPPSPDTGSSSSPSTGASSPPPPTDSSSSPPSIESNSPPPSTGSGSSPPSTGSSSSPPSTGSSSSPPSSGSSPSPPSNESSSSPPSSGSSSPPPATESVTSPPLTYPSPSSNSGSTPSSPFHSPQSAPPPPSSSGPDSPSQGKPSDEGSPPALSKSKSPPSPDNPSTLDGPPSLSISSPPSIPKVGESSPADNEKSPSKPSESRSSGDSPMAHSDFLSSRNSSHLIPPSIIPSKDSSNNGGTSVGASVSLILAGIAITLIAIFIVIARRKKKKRMNTFIGHYRQSPNFSLKQDNYYNTNENPMGSFSFSGPHYGAPTRLSNASLSMYGSQRGQGYYSGPDPSGSKSCFSYEELMEITNGFSRENIIGEGGFGSVYKGVLPDGKYVAVKQLKAGSGQGEREFRAEVEIISRVHHRHLVSLVGYGIYDAQRLLVYEFVSNNTLEHHLHGNGLIVMEWSKRQKIAIGSAKGLAYLHEDCHPRIIHRDIKSANILIDDDWEAQVADFGLAKLSNDTHTHVSTRVMGTFGYLAPEYASSGKLTDRSDVYSFGVVLLELITGRKPVDASQPLGDESLVEWARPVLVQALETGNFDQLVDPRLGSNYEKIEMFRMIEAAAACIRHSAPKRPRMAQVVRALDCEGDMSDLSNGMKFGQSQVFDSSQYSSDIQRFRRMALGTEEFSSEYGNSGEFDRRSSMHSGEYRTRERSGEFSGESETRAMFSRPGQRSEVGSYRYGSRGFP